MRKQMTDKAQQSHLMLKRIVLDLENAMSNINEDEYLDSINVSDELFKHLDEMQTRVKVALIAVDHTESSWEREET